jgi:hypothetical protein
MLRRRLAKLEARRAGKASGDVSFCAPLELVVAIEEARKLDTFPQSLSDAHLYAVVSGVFDGRGVR